MTHTMEAPYMVNNLFYSRFHIIKDTTGVLAKVMFNDLQALKARINKHDED